ncbi:MAG: DUF2490 domain-containing protein [Deltaproteobacteria bacterium]|nr:DUF2490 domain-containing protein [Deltaproteobacteria bacterium]
MTRRLLLPLLALALLSPLPARAAPEAQLWLEGGVRYRPVKELWLSFDQHLRWDNDLTRLRKIMPELGLRYGVHKNFRAALGYRLIAEGNNQRQFTTAHRVMLDLLPRYRVGEVTLAYRARLQLTSGASGSGDPLEPVLRQRIGLAYGTELGVEPFVEAELYLQLGGGTTGATKWRLTLGAAYSIADHDCELFYRVQRPIGDPNPDTWHILGLGYRFSIR